MNEMQNNSYAPVSNNITTVKSLRAQQTIHIMISEAAVCFYLLTLSAIHAVQHHMTAALVHAEL